MQLMKSKKGLGLDQAAGAVMAFGLVIVFAAVMGLVLSNIKAGMTADTVEANITTKGLSGLLNFANLTPTVGTVLGAALIIGIVATAIGVYSMNR
jgi:hypothetical protein